MPETDEMPWLRTCETCGNKYGGSHYHCSCGSLDVTGMYGHHTAFCRLKPGQMEDRRTEFHHCGPNGDCDLAPALPAAAATEGDTP